MAASNHVHDESIFAGWMGDGTHYVLICVKFYINIMFILDFSLCFVGVGERL